MEIEESYQPPNTEIAETSILSYNGSTYRVPDTCFPVFYRASKSRAGKWHRHFPPRTNQSCRRKEYHVRIGHCCGSTVQLVKDKAKSFTSEIMKFGKVLSPSKEKPLSVPESPVWTSQVPNFVFSMTRSIQRLLMFYFRLGEKRLTNDSGNNWLTHSENIQFDSQVPSLLVIAVSAPEEPVVAKTASDFKADHLRERTIRVNSWSRANETHRLLILLQRRNPFQNKAHRLDYWRQ